MFDWTNSDLGQDRQSFVTTFSYIGCTLAVVLFIIGSLSKRVICRCIPSLGLQLPSIVTRVGTIIMQAFSVACATVLVLNQTQGKAWLFAAVGEPGLLNIWEDFALGMNVVLSLRAFKRALTAPLLF